MLRQRVLSALVFVPLLLLAVWYGDPWFTGVFAGIALLAAYEFFRLASRAGHNPIHPLGFLGTFLFVLNAHSGALWSTPALLGAAAVLSLAWLIIRRRHHRIFPDWTWTMLGMLYIGALMSFFIALRGLPLGREWTLMALLGTFAVDTFAYLIGRTLGRHRMAGAISPSKTWEGAFGGVLGGIVVVLLLSQGLRVPLTLFQGVALGFSISLAGQLGDLFESVLKRLAGAKDASNLVPGHGGILDRLDSLLPSGVVVYYFVTMIVLP